MSTAVRPRHVRLTYNASRRQISSSEITALPRIRTHLAVALVGMSAVLWLAACSSPSSTARACSAKTQMEASLNQLRSFDFTNPNAASLAGILDSMAHQLTSAEAAVPLPQNAPLRDLGGVGYLRQLNRELTQSADQLRAAHAGGQQIVVFQLRPTITTQAGQVQRVADGITGC